MRWVPDSDFVSPCDGEHQGTSLAAARTLCNWQPGLACWNESTAALLIHIGRSYAWGMQTVPDGWLPAVPLFLLHLHMSRADDCSVQCAPR